MVGLALMVARVFQVGEVQSLSGDGLSDGYGTGADAEDAGQRTECLHTVLLLHLGAHLLGRVTGYGVGDLMAEHDGQRGLVLSDGQDALIDADQSARHTPGIDLIALHEVELPLIVLQVVLHAGSFQIGGHSGGQVLPHSLHHRRVLGIGGELGALHEL